MNVNELKDGERSDGFLYVRVASRRTTKVGKAYLDLVLSGRDAVAVTAKDWDYNPEVVPPAPGDVVFVSGRGNLYNNKMQLIIDEWRLSVPEDCIDVADFVPSAPGDPQAMLKTVQKAVAGFRDDSIRNIVTQLLREACADDALLTAPAAVHLHHALRSGLLYHMTTMLKMAEAVCGIYPFLDADLLLAGVVIHDLGKLKELNIESSGVATGYSTDGKLIGHLVRGAMDIERVSKEVKASPERAMLLQHIVLSHHGKTEFGSPVLPKIPEAEALSLLDLFDARLFQMEAALSEVEDGGFSEKVWAMDNRELYKVPSGGESQGELFELTNPFS